MGRRRLEPETRRRAILAAAVEAIDDVGLDQVSLETVAERAGVSRALVYTYFTNRQRLVHAVFGQVVVDLEAQLAAALADATTPEERVRRGIATLAGYARRHPHRWQVLRWTVLSSDPGSSDGLDELLDHLGPLTGGEGRGSSRPLVLTALLGMVDWTADRIDEQGATELARLAWRGTSGVAIDGDASAETPGRAVGQA